MNKSRRLQSQGVKSFTAKEGRARRFFQVFLRDLGVFAVQILTIFELKGDFANTLMNKSGLLGGTRKITYNANAHECAGGLLWRSS